MGIDFTRFLVLLGSATLIAAVVSTLTFLISRPFIWYGKKRKAEEERLKEHKDHLSAELQEMRKMISELSRKKDTASEDLYSNRSLYLKLDEIYNKLLSIESGLDADRYLNGTKQDIAKLLNAGPEGIDDAGNDEED